MTMTLYTCNRQLRDQDASRLAGQLHDLETRIVEEAGQAPGSGFKVVEATSQRGLTATPGRQKRHHKIGNGVALMAVCVVKDQVDILNKASWSIVLSRHNPKLYRVNHSIQLAP
jgi:hypothetical protein